MFPGESYRALEMMREMHRVEAIEKKKRGEKKSENARISLKGELNRLRKI